MTPGMIIALVGGVVGVSVLIAIHVMHAARIGPFKDRP